MGGEGEEEELLHPKRCLADVLEFSLFLVGWFSVSRLQSPDPGLACSRRVTCQLLWSLRDFLRSAACRFLLMSSSLVSRREYSILFSTSDLEKRSDGSSLRHVAPSCEHKHQFPRMPHSAAAAPWALMLMLVLMLTELLNFISIKFFGSESF